MSRAILTIDINVSTEMLSFATVSFFTITKSNVRARLAFILVARFLVLRHFVLRQKPTDGDYDCSEQQSLDGCGPPLVCDVPGYVYNHETPCNCGCDDAVFCFSLRCPQPCPKTELADGDICAGQLCPSKLMPLRHVVLPREMKETAFPTKNANVMGPS